ncbi:P-loop containing nucleoside triphosphate hydrolase protein [Ascodesmis nigricans]|uniref:RNA helicase n=1 Tax=Ascodesmis nigricans TaxID=341454 RepID=A0A4S2N7D6_9PEZI|nr:P-loop containing nucleoside triphosphate hydrolase protein [Ascodesmis nigricans]
MPPKSYKPTRERKQKRRKTVQRDGTLLEPTADSTTVLKDTNVEIVIPGTTKASGENDSVWKKEPEALESKMSAKKRKRFNKYMETKLRKDETQALLAKLAETQVDTSLFASAKSIGTAKESKRERIRRALREEQAGLNMEENSKILYEHRQQPAIDDGDVEMGMSSTFGLPTPLEERNQPVAKETEKEATEEDAKDTTTSLNEKKVQMVSLSGKSSVGSGLKRPLVTDPSELPVIKRLRKKAPVPTFTVRLPAPGECESDDEEDPDDSSETGSNASHEYEEWNGFSDDAKSDDGEEASSLNDSGSDDDDSEGSEDGEDEEDEEDEEDDEDEEDESSEEGLPAARIKPGRSERANAFKDWALSQQKATVDGDDGPTVSNIESLASVKLPADYVPRSREEDMTPPPELLNIKDSDRKAYHVLVDRAPEVEAQRSQLPVVSEEQRIMEAIHNNPCVVICGETGSGKTTQIPQFLYEAGYGSPDSDTPGLIAVTQPRRVAAVSMASRVGEELGIGGKEKVAYQIRFDGTVGPKTAIKFMTDGVLLRELAADFLLRKYSAVIIDEAHERSVNTDILIGVMSRVLKLRADMAKQNPKETKPLKLIIMSATLRVSDFVENKTLFPTPPPLLKIDARQHPVTTHFSRRTATNYIEEAYKKTCKIHRRLPPGGILVFLTGQNEIVEVMRKLKKTFPATASSGGQLKQAPVIPSAPPVKVVASESVLETEDVDLGDSTALDNDTVADVEEKDDYDSASDSDLGEESGPADVESPLHVLPLYSLLPTKEQLRVFDPPPEGARLCILATNIAETSLTIPGIRYVIDTGRVKARHYDLTTGVQSFQISFTSKASAAQRAGRAGRTGPGHCYRLFSSAVFESTFPQFEEAEILRMPIEGVVLQMKAMSIDTIANFPFPTPPDRDSLRKAEKLLRYLRALDTDGRITELGKTMNIFPLSPRFAKVLIVGQQLSCLPYIIAIVAALSVGDVFIPEHQALGQLPRNGDNEEDQEGEDSEAVKRLRQQYHRAHAAFGRLDGQSDALKLLSVVCAYDYEADGYVFCRNSFVRLKAMEETRKLRQQIHKIVVQNCPGVLPPKFEPKLPPPSDIQVKALSQILASGFIDNLAIRADLLPSSPFPATTKSRSLSSVPYLTLFPTSANYSAVAASTDPEVFAAQHATYIHPTSVLHLSSSFPDYIAYSSLTRGRGGEGKTWMMPLTTVKGTQLARLADGTGLVSWGKPLESRMPKEVEVEGGKGREVWVVPRMGMGIGSAGVGWQLPPCRKIQKLRGGKWVFE